MPRISEFYGIIIALYYNDHEPPHIHAIYGEYHVLIGIQPVEVMRGAFPPRALGLVIEWMTIHHSELAEDWGLAREHRRLRRIAPLE